MVEKNKKQTLKVSEYDQMGFCHNKKCHLYNMGEGNAGLEDRIGKVFRCCACGKGLYGSDDGSGEVGDGDIDL